MSKDNEMRLSAPASVWLWISVAAAVVGAFMLFPIGTTPLNVIFVAVKACMVIGLAVVLFARRLSGFVLWSVASAAAVVMTIIKWVLAASFEPVFALALVVDVVMPTVAWRLLHAQ
ncbi:MAG: hypothetical protein SOI23_04860 [Atopobiaceae bacterium]|jgi:hypothetical protein